MQRLLIYPDYQSEVTEDWFDNNYWRQKQQFAGLATGGRDGASFFEQNGKYFILKHYKRGGKVAKINKDKYLYFCENKTRSFAEFRLHKFLFDKGLPVAKPVAARFIKSSLFYTADNVSEKILNAQTLAQYLQKTSNHKIIDRVTQTVAQFHRIGLNHTDLNAHNILITPSQIYLIDFDKCNLRGNAQTNKANLLRLKRSINKLGIF